MTKENFLKAKEDYVGLLMQGNFRQTNVYIEGKDDYNFYYQFFKDLSPNIVKCYRKTNVLKVAKLHEKIGDFKCIFFVDKDFDDNEEIPNVFTTDYYNYESHIFSRINISNYLKNKHSLHQTDINKLIDFLNSDAVLKMFHTEYERIKLHDGSVVNKLIDGRLNKIRIDENYCFEYTDLFTQCSLPILETEIMEDIEMYNGKHIGNLLFGIFQNNWYEKKFDSDMKVKDRKQLHNDMIIHCDLPEYVNNAIHRVSKL